MPRARHGRSRCFVHFCLQSSRQGTWFYGRDRGGGARHTSSLHSLEVARSLSQCRQRCAFDSALCLHGFHGLQSITCSPSKSTCWVSVLCWVSEIWRSSYWTTKSCLPEGSLSTDEGGLWRHIRRGLLVQAFCFWLFTFLTELKIKLLFLPHFSILYTILPQSIEQPCCSFNWLLNFTLVQTEKLHWASTGY